MMPVAQRITIQSKIKFVRFVQTFLPRINTNANTQPTGIVQYHRSVDAILSFLGSSSV